MANNNPKTTHLESTKWSKGYCPNPTGRPKKVETNLIENGYSPSEVLNVFHEIAWMTKRDLKLLVEDEEQPVIVSTIARIFLIVAPDSYLPSKHIRYVSEIFKYLLVKPPKMIATQSHIIHSKAKDNNSPAPEDKTNNP